ncbi:MAG: sodium-transporting two-sector ATPase [Candidatus Woesebacteria bacterium]
MFDNTNFKQLVENNHPTGEVVGVDRFLVSVKGLDGVAIGALVMFETGQAGMVHEVGEDIVLILSLSTETTKIGELVVLQENSMTTKVGNNLIGRTISPLGEPLDGRGAIQFDTAWPTFNKPPTITERSMLSDPLPSGVTIVDSLFPIVLGQRITVLGDAKSGKSSFLLQLANNQTNTDRIVVYVLIGKRRLDIDQTVASLTQSGAIDNSIVVAADMFDSLAQSYLAPYAACSIAEYLWHQGRDVVIIYDDLSSHAKVYREISLLAGANPGRESYPGDMFYAHSSLLERAGKLANNNKTLTALPVITSPGDDITAYLPTSVMSITDGQIIFDLATFRQNIRPAVNTGLSVSRVGGRSQSPRQKMLSGILFKRIADYRQASEFAHYGADIAPETRLALHFGHLINEAFLQPPNELYSSRAQQLILETVIASGGQFRLNMPLLKSQAQQLGQSVQTDDELDPIVQQLLQATIMGEPA